MTHDKQIDLRDCPFCGEERASYVHVSEPDSGYVHCLACEASCGDELPYNEAMIAWNTRATDTRIKKLEAALRWSHCLTKAHVKPQRCVTMGDHEVKSAGEIFQMAQAALEDE